MNKDLRKFTFFKLVAEYKFVSTLDTFLKYLILQGSISIWRTGGAQKKIHQIWAEWALCASWSNFNNLIAILLAHFVLYSAY